MSFPAESPLVDEVLPSPNHGDRRGAGTIDLLILHYTGMPDSTQALNWLCNTASEVSSHYFVFESGRVLQLVPESRRAWHAGASSWKGESDINSRSIGSEIANPGPDDPDHAYPQAQIDAVIALCRDIITRNPIQPEGVLAHSDVAPGRKIDPGEVFPWRRLHEAGVGHYVDPEPISGGRFFQEGDVGQPVEALQSMLAAYGYSLQISGTFDRATRQVVEAFQRHFRREKVDGVADSSTITTLYKLIGAIPK